MTEDGLVTDDGGDPNITAMYMMEDLEGVMLAERIRGRRFHHRRGTAARHRGIRRLTTFGRGTIR